MVSWSARRQLLYLSVALAVLLFVLALPVFFVSYKAPSCTDGKQNQGELGIDCGGPCSVLCKANALDLIVRWQRAFRIKDGVYSVVAYVENPNLDSGINSISYRFKLYDSDNVLIYERDGNTFVPPKKIFAIFEKNIFTGARVPARALFEFLSPPVWDRNVVSEPALVVTNKSLSTQSGSPRLDASLENRSDTPVYNVEVVAILYDESDNAVAVSRTEVDALPRGGAAPLVFTWPEAFENSISRVEFIYRVLR